MIDILAWYDISKINHAKDKVSDKLKQGLKYVTRLKTHDLAGR